MMKHVWALSALTQAVLAIQGSFSVLDDLLAFPQYQIKFSDHAVSDEHAKSLYLSSQTADSQKGAVASNVDVSQQPQHDSSIPLGVTEPFHRDQEHDEELRATYERLILHSRPYLCRIPIVDTTGNRTAGNATQSAVDEEKELMRATDRGWELLKGMQGNCIYFLSGWWSYSFCYNEGVKQFHQLPPSRGVPIYPPVEDESVTSYILGRFPEDGGNKGKKDIEAEEANVDDEGNSKGSKKDEDTAIARMETKGETRYLVQKLTGGTTCDLTGKERKIEVQFHCHPNTPDRIGMIKEVATCSYLMVIYTPRLCNDAAFLPPQQNRAHDISCAPIVSSGSHSEATLPSAAHHYHGEAAIDKAVKPNIKEDTSIQLPPALAAAASGPRATSRPLPTVGGTVVGAKQLVGQPGSRIEKSVVVGGGKETLLGIVASSDGRGKEITMSPEQLHKLDIKDPRDIEDLKKKLNKLAAGKPWRLELVDTPRGREFRGIIDTDDEQNTESIPPSKGKDKTSGKEAGSKKKDDTAAPPTDGEDDGWKWEFEWFDWDEGKREPNKNGNGDGDGDGDGEGSEEEYREEL